MLVILGCQGKRVSTVQDLDPLPRTGTELRQLIGQTTLQALDAYRNYIIMIERKAKRDSMLHPKMQDIPKGEEL